MGLKTGAWVQVKVQPHAELAASQAQSGSRVWPPGGSIGQTWGGSAGRLGSPEPIGFGSQGLGRGIWTPALGKKGSGSRSTCIRKA